MCRDNLKRVREEDGWEELRGLIVTGDETWVPFFDPPIKQETMVSKLQLIFSLLFKFFAVRAIGLPFLNDMDIFDLVPFFPAGLGEKKMRIPL